MTRRRKFDEVPTLPLFDEPARSRPRRQATPKPYAHGNCPHCTGERIAIDRSGRHLVWREHLLRTYSGAYLPCRSSGVALCVAPAGTEQAIGATPKCLHPNKSDDGGDAA